MTVQELREALENMDGNMEVKLCYQPHYPMQVDLDHTCFSVNENTTYLCQSGYGGNEYSKSAVFEAYEGDNIDDYEED